MPYMVIYRTPDGAPGYHQADSLTDAVGRVEHLRNDDGVDQARIFHMEEVAFEFRPYYRVEVAGVAEEPAPAIAAPVATASVEAGGAEWSVVETADDPLGPVQAPAGPADDVRVGDLPPPPPAPALVGDDPLGSDIPRRGLFGR